jgi:hypothetical protein
MNLTDHLFYDNFIILSYDDYIDRMLLLSCLLSDSRIIYLINLYYYKCAPILCTRIYPNDGDESLPISVLYINITRELHTRQSYTRYGY